MIHTVCYIFLLKIVNCLCQSHSQYLVRTAGVDDSQRYVPPARGGRSMRDDPSGSGTDYTFVARFSLSN
jgi:hypothetical protein